MMNSREAAYLALLASMRNDNFIAQSLDQWKQRENPDKLDLALAYEIASGSSRMALALDYIGAALSTQGKLQLKAKEKALLRLSIYQYCYMDKIPLYAITNEAIELAKKYCHPRFVSFLNALLRRLADYQLALPPGDTLEELSIRYSYPTYFIEALLADYGLETTKLILETGNRAPKIMARIRPGIDLKLEAFKYLHLQRETGLPVAVIDKAASLSALAQQPEIYIQNATPVSLVAFLADQNEAPKSILDLCASPGGKLLATHDLYPEAKLFANDVSQEKILRLSQNLAKYGVRADLTCGPGEVYESNQKFDLIILDVPCSNSGVLNKRPEARWRLDEQSLDKLQELQNRLLEHAVSLLSPSGTLWYLSCSILKEENEQMIENFCRNKTLKVVRSRTILPNEKGWDGGFAALLKNHP